MDRLVLERTEVETEIEPEVQKATETDTPETEPEVQEEFIEPIKSYADSFEGKTLGDFKKERQEKELQEFQKEKDQLIQQQFESSEPKQESQNIIEKPNYDLLEEPAKTVKISRKQKAKPKSKKRLASIALACTLGASAVICVANTVIIDNLSSSYSQISETYNLNLQKYLKNISNLDTTQKGMGILDTYPEEELDAGESGKKSNWFDSLCNFLGGLFGG